MKNLSRNQLYFLFDDYLTHSLAFCHNGTQYENLEKSPFDRKYLPIAILESYLSPISINELLLVLNCGVKSKFHLPTSCEQNFKEWDRGPFPASENEDYFTEEDIFDETITFDVADFISWVCKHEKVLRARGQFSDFWKKIDETSIQEEKPKKEDPREITSMIKICAATLFMHGKNLHNHSTRNAIKRILDEKNISLDSKTLKKHLDIIQTLMDGIATIPKE